MQYKIKAKNKVTNDYFNINVVLINVLPLV